MTLINARLDALFRRNVEQLITDLGDRIKVDVVRTTSTRCPNCRFDRENNAGSGVYNGDGPEPFDRVCPVCENRGVLKTEQKTRIKANVLFGDPDNPARPWKGGDILEGQAKLKTFIKYKALLEAANHFLLNGVRYTKVAEEPKATGLKTQVTAKVILKRDS
jgi:hypothetical protein